MTLYTTLRARERFIEEAQAGQARAWAEQMGDVIPIVALSMLGIAFLWFVYMMTKTSGGQGLMSLPGLWFQVKQKELQDRLAGQHMAQEQKANPADNNDHRPG